MTLDEFKYDSSMNAFIYGEKHADKLVNRVGNYSCITESI